ncbi:hypothetical protein LG197_22055 [Pseudomonas asiatica]|uniref:Uncharacterized protein n=1 Tax=Pseudomonas putida TaxID=303 RepID=A0AAW5HNT5_PSEPU|nr:MULTISPECIES: hypothetical protein [Pseudomonas]MCO1622748.1 hypothetical protein [Pseudomonas putida]UTL89083.1 hypothetical protein NLL86_16540 [Pseudomonas fluorescens]WDM87284.1 hypothetical protein LG197_22055 [Pseudomonas asiatica]
MDESKSPTFSLQATWLGISVGAGFALGYAKAQKHHLFGGFLVLAVFAPDGHVQPGAKYTLHESHIQSASLVPSAVLSIFWSPHAMM